MYTCWNPYYKYSTEIPAGYNAHYWKLCRGLTPERETLIREIENSRESGLYRNWDEDVLEKAQRYEKVVVPERERDILSDVICYVYGKGLCKHQLTPTQRLNQKQVSRISNINRTIERVKNQWQKKIMAKTTMEKLHRVRSVPTNLIPVIEGLAVGEFVCRKPQVMLGPIS